MRSIAILVLVLLNAVGANFFDGTSAASPLPTTADLLNDIQLIRNESDPLRRNIASYHLYGDLDTLWQRKGMNTIDDSVIDELILLLDEDDDGIRAMAAGGIGGFGTRARRAEPSLNRALMRIEKERSESSVVIFEGNDSLAPIVFALKRIRGLPEDRPLPDRGKQDGQP